jgi:hypothetical protein
MLERVGSTAIYRSQDAAARDYLLFFRWEATSVPQTLTFDQIWDGTRDVGYFLFPVPMPGDGDLVQLEAALRILVPPPAAPSFAWLQTSSTGPPVINTLLKLKLEAGETVLDGETALNLPPGMKTVIFPDATRVLQSVSGGQIDGSVFTYPAEPVADPPKAIGVLLPLTDGRTGCVCFTGLVGDEAGRKPGSIIKSLVRAQIDPLRPFDSQRTYQVFSGLRYELQPDESGYSIVPVK